MSNLAKHVVATVIGLILAIVDVAYMMYLRVPSVIEIRPNLADAGLVTGLFSGRPLVYLFHNFTTPIIVLNVVLFVLMLNLFVVEEKPV